MPNFQRNTANRIPNLYILILEQHGLLQLTFIHVTSVSNLSAPTLFLLLILSTSLKIKPQSAKFCRFITGVLSLMIQKKAFPLDCHWTFLPDCYSSGRRKRHITVTTTIPVCASCLISLLSHSQHQTFFIKIMQLACSAWFLKNLNLKL